MQRGSSRYVTQGETQQRADDAKGTPLKQNLTQQLPPRQPEHTQQSELVASPNDRKRLRRKYQECAGEQRHHGEHVQVDAISARHVGNADFLIYKFRDQKLSAEFQFLFKRCLECSMADTSHQFQFNTR